MSRGKKDLTATEVVAQRDDVECTGLFDRGASGDQRRCVVMAVSETTPRLCGVVELVASTTEKLLAVAIEAGWELGTQDHVEELCKPVWLKTKTHPTPKKLTPKRKDTPGKE